MAIAPFEEWRPDLVAFGNPGLTGALNVIPAPGGTGYGPFPSPVGADAPLPAAPLGGLLARLTDASYTYVGTQARAYMRSGGSWVDVSRPVGYALQGDDAWEMVQFRDKVIAVCGSAAPVQVAGVAGDDFEDLPTSDRKPRARRVGLVNGWPVLGHTFDDQDGEQPSRLWWPQLVQIPNPAEWDPDLTTQANYTVSTPRAADGAVLAIVDGIAGIIVCERAIYRMRYVNLPEIFEFDLIATRGAISAGSVVNDGRTTYFIDRDGFYACDGNDVMPIGHGKVDRTIMARLNRNAVKTICSGIIPERSVVVWLLPLDNAETPNRAIIYSWKEQRFTEAEIAGVYFGETTLPGMSFDQEPWASAPLAMPPWGDFAWGTQEYAGGQPLPAVIGTDGTMSYLTGPALPATLRTQEVAPSHPFVTEVQSVHPVVEGGGEISVRVGTRPTTSAATEWGDWRTPNLVGFVPYQTRGVFLIGEVSIPGDFTQAIGLDYTSRRAGRR